MEKLIKKIQEDEKLRQLTANLIQATEYAKDRPNKINQQQGELRLRMKELEENRSSITHYDPETSAFKDEFYQRETKDNLLLKIYLLKQTERRSWELDLGYLKAKKEYCEYVAPLLREIGREQTKNKVELEKLEQKYMKDRLKHENNMINSESYVEELMSHASEISMYSLTKRTQWIYGIMTSEGYMSSVAKGVGEAIERLETKRSNY